MERQTVSGWWTSEGSDCACVNQVWNWVKGEGWSWERERVDLVYWSACGLLGVLDGATVVEVSWGVRRWWGRGCTDEFGA